MLDLFYQGGYLFMSLISIAHIALFVAMIADISGKSSRVLVREAGLLALGLGILGQMIGLFDAFKAIEIMGGVSTEMLVGGPKVSMITTLYGLIGFILSRLYLAIKAMRSA